MSFTFTELCEQAKKSTNLYTLTSVPAMSYFYFDFAEKAGLDIDEMYTLNKFIQKVSYDEKRAIFEKLGFNVLYMTLSIVKMGHILADKPKDASGKPDTSAQSLEEQFLDNKRNVFILEVETGYENIYFLLEYPLDIGNGDDPLANYTVDRAELQRKKEQSERIRKLFKRN